MKFRFIILLLCVVTEPVLLHAQEPTKPIVPADPISVAVRTPMTSTVSSAIDPGAPMIYPDPRPTTMKLGVIARTFRAIHATAPKAVKVANDDAPIVADEPKESQ